MEQERCKNCIYLQAQIDELSRRLLAYENAHTPPSKNRRRYPKREPTGNPIGAPKGHAGTTRSTPEPDETVDVKQDTCTTCHQNLGKPAKVIKRIIEDIPQPHPIKVTQYNIHTYLCKNCAEINIPVHLDCPTEGKFGYNLQTQIAVMKYEDRLPLRKIAENLNRQYNLNLTPATVLTILERVAYSCEPAYEQIRKQVRQARNVYADETGQKVQGKQWWTWVFTTLTHALFLIRKSRGQQPVKEVLGDDYQGILNCDGLNVYPKKVKQIQRCWAHLLREAKYLAEQHEGQARQLYKLLCELFADMNHVREQELTNHEREQAMLHFLMSMHHLIEQSNTHRTLRRFARKMENGLQYWFTCVSHTEVEPTNNRAERALREMVVQRKITGTLRNERGTHITEVLMSCIQTWKLQGLNTFSMLRQTLRS